MKTNISLIEEIESILESKVTNSKSINNILITYSELCNEIKCCTVLPHSPELWHHLAEVSKNTYINRKVLLSAIVIKKHGDMIPGSGFYKLAKSLGRKAEDNICCWLDELKFIYKEYLT